MKSFAETKKGKEVIKAKMNGKGDDQKKAQNAETKEPSNEAEEDEDGTNK